MSLPTLALVYAGAASMAEWGGRDRALGWWKLLAATAATGAVNTLRPRLGGLCLRVVSLGLFPGSSTVFYHSARPCTLSCPTVGGSTTYKSALCAVHSSVNPRGLTQLNFVSNGPLATHTLWLHTIFLVIRPGLEILSCWQEGRFFFEGLPPARILHQI